jgi:hypothetical protein
MHAVAKPSLKIDIPVTHKSDASTLKPAHAPGHWVLARLGKKVLRPGGLGATRMLLKQMNITRRDDVVEFAPGMGLTAEMILQSSPASYTGVERDVPAARRLRSVLDGRGRVYDGSAESSGLPTMCASRVVGEAMLSMHPIQVKEAIIAEASRLLTPGGLYGIHELVLRPDNAAPRVRRELCSTMSKVIHQGVTPLSTREWLALLDEHDFVPVSVEYVPFRLLNPARLVADEGWPGALKFGWNLLRDKDARKRVLAMRKVFSKYRDNLSAIVIVARKK